jgi:hypothetical protein
MKLLGFRTEQLLDLFIQRFTSHVNRNDISVAADKHREGNRTDR